MANSLIKSQKYNNLIKTNMKPSTLHKGRNAHSQEEIKIHHQTRDDKSINKEDTLSSISQISQVDESKDVMVKNNPNLSRDDYAQVLGHLTQKNITKQMAESPMGNSMISSKLLTSKHKPHKRNFSKQVKGDTKILSKNASDLILPNLHSRTITKKNNNVRIRKLEFKFKQEIDANINAYALPETKYDVDTIQEMRIQNMIVYNEVTCLLEKAKGFRTECIGTILFHLDKVTIETKRSFNIKLEKLCGMMIQISLIILQEFATDPLSIGIQDMSYLLKQRDKVTDEIKTCEENFKVIDKVVTFLEDSREAYSIISSSSDRTSARPSEILKLLSLISRARFYCSEVTERIRLMERNSTIKKTEVKK